METRDWLRASIAFGAGNDNLWQYIHYDDPDECIRRMLSDPALQADEYVTRFKRVSNAQLDAVFDGCQRHGITVVTRDSEDYPEEMNRLAVPPAVLFAVGDISLFNSLVSAGIVGTRKCTEYGAAIAAQFAGAFASERVNTVSGFAVGIDTAAHNGALEAGGYTAAFLGCGVLYDYPKGTFALRKRIAGHGVVVSEYLPGSQPFRQNFKVRNRLIAAVSDCVLVVEAGCESGSMNTASHAAELGREVFVIPPSDLNDCRFQGQVELLREGASLALSANDILEHLRKINS